MKAEEIEMIKLYWEEFKYRHETYWKLFFKFCYAIIFLLAIPYVYPEKIRTFAKWKILFPIMGSFLSILAAWILAAEYIRISCVYEKYTGLKPQNFKPTDFTLYRFGKVLKYRIGNVVTVIFLVGFFLLSITELVFIIQTSSINTKIAVEKSNVSQREQAVQKELSEIRKRVETSQKIKKNNSSLQQNANPTTDFGR